MSRFRCIPYVTPRKPFSRFTTRGFFKFKRERVPPLQEARESPYIVGPYLKPDYLPRRYITEPIKSRDDNDLDHFIYQVEKVEFDSERTVKLLLTEDVEGLGVAGQVVDAPFRYGASRLIPLKKAEYATDFAHNWYKFGPKTTQSASTALSPRTARLLANQVFKLPIAKTVMPKAWHISLALRLSGCLCPEDAIVKDSIEEIKSEDGSTFVKCSIMINNHEKVDVKFIYYPLEKKL